MVLSYSIYIYYFRWKSWNRKAEQIQSSKLIMKTNKYFERKRLLFLHSFCTWINSKIRGHQIYLIFDKVIHNVKQITLYMLTYKQSISRFLPTYLNYWKCIIGYGIYFSYPNFYCTIICNADEIRFIFISCFNYVWSNIQNTLFDFIF